MSYTSRTRSAIVLVTALTVGTLAVSACGSSGNTSTPAVPVQTQPAIPHLNAITTMPGADYCAGLPDAVGERGGPSLRG